MWFLYDVKAELFHGREKLNFPQNKLVDESE